jgi:hypothetical protein
MTKIKSAGTCTGFAGNYIPAGSAAVSKDDTTPLRSRFWIRLLKIFFIL